MKKPMSEKTQEIRDLIDDLFPGTSEAIEEMRCPLCSGPIDGFRDKLSEREYEISGMCQLCQDKFFGVN